MATRRVRRLRCVLVVALGVAALGSLPACGGDEGADASPPPTTAAPRTLTADFEGGTTTGWTSADHVSVTAAAAHDGSRGLEVAATGSEADAALASPR